MNKIFTILIFLNIVVFNVVSQDFDYIESKAEEGNPVAQTRLGIYYYQGKNVEKDPKKAFRWFLKGAKKGVPLAQYYVGTMYRFGDGVGKNFKKAISWFEKASNQNHARAQYMLASMYYLGLGTNKNFVKAYFYYKLSLENKIKQAKTLLNELKSKMSQSQIKQGNNLFKNWKLKRTKKEEDKKSSG